MDLVHLYRNVGLGGVLRGLGVWLVMLGMSIHVVVRDGQIAPLVAVAVATSVPMLLRRWLVRHLDVSAPVIKYGGYTMLAIAATSGAWLDRIDEEHEIILGTAVVGCAALYCAAWFMVASDPAVFTERGRSRPDTT